MPKMICICILLIYFKVISKKGGQSHYCPRLPYIFIKKDSVEVKRICLNLKLAYQHTLGLDD